MENESEKEKKLTKKERDALFKKELEKVKEICKENIEA